MRRELRIWWPKEYQEIASSSCDILFGWFISSSPASLDVVVALAVSESCLSQLAPVLEEIIQETNRILPVTLQEKSMISMLGQHVSDLNNDSSEVGKAMKCYSASIPNGVNLISSLQSKNSNCGCFNMMEACGVSMGSNMWIRLVHETGGESALKKLSAPKVHHIHWDGKVVSPDIVHVIFYEIPSYGSHHFSLSYSDVYTQAKTSLKKPHWVNELHMIRPHDDLDAVILAVNSSAAVARFFPSRGSATEKSILRFSIIWMLYTLTWHALATSVATLSTLFYLTIQCLYHSGNVGLLSWMWISSTKAFNTTWTNIRIRSCQILYWSIVLQESGPRSYSCVEYEEKTALRRHSVWSSIAADVFLGNLIGLALLYNEESTCSWIQDFGCDVSNWLRTGCVWLMGVPAGFKLNTEVAAVLGTISLNVTQIWSTLCIFTGFLLCYIIRGLALLGMIFGATVFAASIRDLVSITALHVSILHWLISLLYSSQTRALAALWRLFRGQKWNPLRLRLDSYDYTVEQHIVGSLLFTPLLLLLPTTSVFYIFFTIMSSSISVLCLLTEALISFIHATPYVKIFLWLVSPKRLPSGIWLQIGSCKSNRIQSAVGYSFDEDGYSHSKNILENAETEKSIDGTHTLTSFLHNTFPSIGQVILPHYRRVFSGAFKPLALASAWGILTGKRLPQTLETHLPTTIPWMVIPVKEYWRLCHSSVLSCMENRNRLSSSRFRIT
ncbi:hypothetical protein SAY87_015465 [Trapa incisa]|uniref:Uncharacterized protein n=1 Tax=Trapa incisa TaxID=236973 RepID=A0AAN7GUA6_9MYRT|nr:hypothetical protein SAY87_015465 [Trapa incisa]